MASNRDRARERQARRRAERSKPVDDPRELMREELEAGAPPSNVGSSESLGYEPSEEDFDESSAYDSETFDPAVDAPDEDVAPTYGRRSRQEAEEGDGAPPQYSNSPRFVQFVLAVRDELVRVQWPDRQTLFTLTGVVLGFVLIAGGYLGALDAIVAKVMNAIL